MNTSHSATLSIADSMRSPTGATRPRDQQPSKERVGNSFDALYQTETAEIDEGRAVNDININDLDKELETGADSSIAEREARDEDDAAPGNAMQKALLGTHEPALGERKDEIPVSTEQLPADEDPVFETKFLHGIGIALPSESSPPRVGEKFPPGGKELPLDSDNSVRAAELSLSDTKRELRDSVAKSEAGISVRGRSDISEGGARPSPARQIDPASLRMNNSSIEQGLDTAQIRVQSEPWPESLGALASKPVQESTNALPGNTAATNNPAAISQIDPAAAQRLNALSETLANHDLNTVARSNNPDWSNTLGEKVHWMRNANVSSAELHLHPAELGSIEIRIVTEDQQARVSFITSSATARDIIEESMPKLRDLLADSGLALEQGDISQKHSDDGHGAKDRQALPDAHRIENESERDFVASSLPTGIGQVDHYV